ncbi:MAG: extracellular solute-binding protein [Rhodobacteraceae bacterium]|nr:extracellular solute-binding protein [Paracoccaceae bacterium]
MRLALPLMTLAALTASPALAEGELNIYNWGDYTPPELIKAFEAAYDVKVTVSDYDSSDTALAKVLAGGHGFDVVLVGSNYLPVWIEKGLVLETRPDQMENFANVMPEWRDPPFDPGRHYSVPWQWGTVGVTVNTDVYKGDPNTSSIIFNPPEELKGKINVIPEMADVMALAIRYVGGEACTSDMEVLKKARDVLVAAKPHWLSMDYASLEQTTQGDFGASVDWNGSSFRARLLNPAITFGFPQEGFPIWADSMVVLADAQNVENAKLFQNFIMDPKNAAMISAFDRYSNSITGSDAFMPADMKDAPEIKIAPDLLDAGFPSRACPPDVVQIYTQIWTELMK